MTEDHPALLAARGSWKAAQAGDKEAWLDLMAEDVCVEDPIGVAPTNPTGKGVRGKVELAVFFEYKGLKHRFVRGQNEGAANVRDGTNLFGREKCAKGLGASGASTPSLAASEAAALDEAPSATHADRLSAIRAAVGGL